MNLNETLLHGNISFLFVCDDCFEKVGGNILGWCDIDPDINALCDICKKKKATREIYINEQSDIINGEDNGGRREGKSE